VALTQNRAQIRANVRLTTNTGGVSALARHPDTSLNEYIDRALGAAHRILTDVLPDLRILSTTSITTTTGTSLYALPADFDHLISVEMSANGVKSWLVAYEMHEHATLTDPSAIHAGIPYAYRLRGSNIDLLPTPTAGYVATLWYVPNATQFASDAQLYDTISRLDDYLIAYAGRFVALRDQNMGLAATCKQMVDEFAEELTKAARNRDKNSPSRVVDEGMADRWGRRLRRGVR